VAAGPAAGWPPEAAVEVAGSLPEAVAVGSRLEEAVAVGSRPRGAAALGARPEAAVAGSLPVAVGWRLVASAAGSRPQAEAVASTVCSRLEAA
jgi:hypothetical protein